MTDTEKLTQKFWSSLKSDRTVMLRIADGKDTARPMTAQTHDDTGHNVIWFFGDRHEGFVSQLTRLPVAAEVTLTGKGHDVFASVEGQLSLSDDRAMIDKLWNPFVAAWYEEGKDDPRLALLRFEPGPATIWMGGSDILAGVKAILGMDLQDDYKDQMTRTRLG